jgi:hypothetical protein
MLILAGVGAGPSGDFQSIATVTVGVSGSSTIDLTSIPSTYKHLQIRGLLKATTGSQVNFKLNSDATANYARHGVMSDGGAASSYGGANTSYFSGLNYAGLPTGANVFATVIVDILDYANTSKYKTVRVYIGQDSNGSGEIGLNSGVWFSTSAISSVNVFLPTGNFAQYSTLALYGING